MRDRETLIDTFEEIKILNQYLYMDEHNTVEFSNGVTRLSLRMDEALRYKCSNLANPEMPEVECSEQMTIPYMLGIIDELKASAPADMPRSFRNRWEEIRMFTLSTRSINKECAYRNLHLQRVTNWQD
jgi:hypothetical protein